MSGWQCSKRAIFLSAAVGVLVSQILTALARPPSFDVPSGCTRYVDTLQGHDGSQPQHMYVTVCLRRMP